MAVWNKREKNQSQAFDRGVEALYIAAARRNVAVAQNIAQTSKAPKQASSIAPLSEASTVAAPTLSSYEVAWSKGPSERTKGTTNELQSERKALSIAAARNPVDLGDDASKKPATKVTSEGCPLTRAVASKVGEKKTSKPSKSELEDWRMGAKGRPTAVFIGFLANASKRDAVKYAIGVAEHNATNVENATYAVFPWNDGWAYEIHEGGPGRAYLPAILRYFDAQGDRSCAGKGVVTIRTARRSVQVERSHNGIIGFLMPESFQGEQTDWLEPGPKLKPVAPVRLGVLAFGGTIFATGFLAMLVALTVRPEAPVVTATRQDIPYDQLPISLWPTLVEAASSGYVNTMQFVDGKYTLSIAGQATSADPATTLPPPLPIPHPEDKR